MIFSQLIVSNFLRGDRVPVSRHTFSVDRSSPRYLHDLGIISELDRAALAAYCQAYGRWVEAEMKLKKHLPLRTPAGYVQPSPWLAISNRNVELMHKFMCELGLSPVSRSRVSTTRSLGPKPWEFD